MSSQDPAQDYRNKDGEEQISVSANDQQNELLPDAQEGSQEHLNNEAPDSSGNPARGLNASSAHQTSEEVVKAPQAEEQQRVTFQATRSGQANYRSDWRNSQAETQDYRRDVSPQLQQDFERTQRVLEQVRARSREQQYMNPSSGNGYEKHNGSPQRQSPKRDQAVMGPPMRTSYQHPSISSSIAQSNRRQSHSPLQEAQNNNAMRSQFHQEQENRDASRNSSQNHLARQSHYHSGKENNNERERPLRQSSPPRAPRQNSATASHVIEHSMAVTASSGTQVNIRGAEGIHDQIIASYRRQLQTSANLDSLYEQLKLRIQDVSQRRAALEDSIRYLRQDYDGQVEQQTRDSEALQQELEQVKRSNAELAHEGNQTNGEIMDAKATLNGKEVEVQRIRNDIVRSQDEGRFLRDAIDDQKRQLAQNYQTKDQQHQKIFQLTAQLKNQESGNFMATSQSNQKTTELNNTREQQRRLDDTLHTKSMQMDDASTKFEIARAELSRNQSETLALQKDCENANGRNNFLLDTQRQLIRQKESEGARSNELNSGVQTCEGKYLRNDQELQQHSRELEAVRHSNESLLEAGHCFKQELHALQNHADLLAMQNNDLQKELDEFVMTDEVIRSGLDRKTRVSVMKERLTHQERDSMVHLEKSRSPIRASRSPLSSVQNTMNNPLTQQYMMSYHKQTDSIGGAGTLNGQVSMQDLCKQQLEENLARERQYQPQQQQAFNMRSFHAKEAEAMSPPAEYRARNGSPLRKV